MANSTEEAPTGATSLPPSRSTNTPVPDPTSLTTQALYREIAALRELLEIRMDGIANMQEEKFQRTDQQFELVEQQRVEQKRDTKSAVDAALDAQQSAVKEQTIASERSITKSEAATTKSIEQLGTTFTTTVDGLRREIADLKERTTGIEQLQKGGKEAQQQQGVTMGHVVGAVGLVVALLGVIAAIVAAVA